MKRRAPYLSNSCVYPGQYALAPGIEKKLARKIRLSSYECTEPEIQMTQQPGHYRFQLKAPGFKREDFIVQTNGRNLSILAVHEQNEERVLSRGTKRISQLCIDKEVDLPRDADPQFHTAEFRNDVLTICFMKTGNPVETTNDRVVVY